MDNIGKEKADELVKKFALGAWGKHHAQSCVEEILADLNESFEVAKELHPHAQGLIAGSISYWNKVLNHIKLHEGI